MKNVTITEASGFQPGGLQMMLLNMGVRPEVASAPGASPLAYKAQMTDEQITHFRLRGFSHKLEVEETPVVDPRDARIAELQTANSNLQRSCDEYEARIQELEAEVHELEAGATKA